MTTVEPGGLTPDEQDELWRRITNLVVHFMPTDSAHVLLTYRALGDYTELPVMVRRVSDGGLELWTPPGELAELLGRLRAGMYRPGRGTWFQAAAQVFVDSRFEYRYTWDEEPPWDGTVPPAAHARELAVFPRDEGHVPGWLRERVSRAAAVTLGGAADPESAAKEALRAAEEAAAELGADSSRFRIGEVADGAWCLVPEGERWAVFWAQGDERLERAVFDTAAQAARYFTGHLYLHRAAFRDELPPDAKRPAEEWPIQPAGDDIGLNLYRGKRLVTLPPGTELDRYGDPSGNTLYAAGTEFPYRSHEPDQERDEYHVYRLRHAVRALTGTAVPWFDQPGGGVAFLLERPVADLLADGVLEEIPHRTVAPPSRP